MTDEIKDFIQKKVTCSHDLSDYVWDELINKFVCSAKVKTYDKGTVEESECGAILNE